jgi:hypothetical protein
MNALYGLAVPTLGHLPAALLHSLWEGLLVLGIVFLLVRRIPVQRGNLRYGVAVMVTEGLASPAAMGLFWPVALLYFNPAVWWLSRQIRIEREACCDATAAGIVGNPIDYAEALACVARYMRGVRPAFAMAQGMGEEPEAEGRLSDRIRRLLLPGYWPKLRLRWHSVALGLLVALAMLFGLYQSSVLSVACAGWFLTDKQRIDVLTELNKDYGRQSLDEGEGEREYVEVSGTVVTADGKPLAGSPLGVEYPGGFWMGLQTDSQGQCMLAGIDPALEFWAIAQPKSQFQYECIKVAQVGENVMRLKAGLAVEGRVLMPGTEQPVSGQVITVYAVPDQSRPQTRNYRVETTTDNEGKFRFTNLCPGKFVVEAFDYASLAMDTPEEARTFSAGQSELLMVHVRGKEPGKS